MKAPTAFSTLLREHTVIWGSLGATDPRSVIDYQLPNVRGTNPPEIERTFARRKPIDGDEVGTAGQSLVCPDSTYGLLIHVCTMCS
jgi:hypothetical protein